jgi:hypothetical protein
LPSFIWGGLVCLRGYAGLSLGWLGEFHVTHGAHLFGLLNVSQAGFGTVSGRVVVAMAAHNFSLCNVPWKKFPWARSLRCWCFGSCWCFISTKCGSSISARFWSCGTNTVCFCTLVVTLENPQVIFVHALSISRKYVQLCNPILKFWKKWYMWF